MTLAVGSRLGPYEILALLGTGGMGEVYRARDPRLNREVAIKVLPVSFSEDADRLRRFEQEAKAAGLLNHPNITAVHDIGAHEGAPYIVTELLEGETLRTALSGGKLSQRKAIDYASQIANGLAAAHEKGIVHRDLKPENLFVLNDGRVKILDFGLAKLTQAEGAGSNVTNLPTETKGTEPGVVLGTLGYMSPEQVRGEPANARSDIFALGAVLYEMLSGNRAFRGRSTADTMSAILKEDPPDLSVTNQSISSGLERIVRHCLEKSPEQRFHSAHDLAFDLEALSGLSDSAAAAPAARRRRFPRLATVALAVGLLLLTFWAGRRIGRESAERDRPLPVFNRLTFHRGNVLFARFAPDGQTIIYGAAWGDRPVEIFLARAGSPESRPLGIANASLLSISPSGELAILMKRKNLFGTTGSGTLARVPMTGGAPREVLEEVEAADWAPDGATFAVLLSRNGRTVLEFPIGRPIHESSVGLEMPRVSPDGRSVAVIERGGGGPQDAILLVDAQGKSRTLTQGAIIDSIAWHPSGRELWFAGYKHGLKAGIYAIRLDGTTRTIWVAGSIHPIHDISRDGRVLLEREITNLEMAFSGPSDVRERNLSWLEASLVASLSPDGKKILFSEVGEGGKGSVYLSRTDGSPPVRLGSGGAADLSPDGKWALAVDPSRRPVLLPTGAGEPRPVEVGNLTVLDAAFVPPDGKRVAIAATEPSHAPRVYVIDLPRGKPVPVTPEGWASRGALSPDGKWLASRGGDDRMMAYPLAGGEPRPIPGVEVGEDPIQWSVDGASLFLARFDELPLKIDQLELASGRRAAWKELMPADRAGLIRIESVFVAPDGKSYAYSCNRVLVSDLYVVQGLR
jgi:Tol biopolymer transport system component